MSDLPNEFSRIAMSDHGVPLEGKFLLENISPSEPQLLSDDESLSGDELVTDDKAPPEEKSLLAAANARSFAEHSLAKRGNVANAVKLIGRDLSKKDIKPRNNGQPAVPVIGVVYVAQEIYSDFVKVGFSTDLDEAKVKDSTTKCGIRIEKWYLTRPFHCAYRTEQIIHRILQHRARHRFDCKCGKKNREWYMTGFGEAIELVNLVCTWMAQRPYDRKTTKLKDEWKGALRFWETSGNMPSLSEFFLMGLELQPPRRILPVYSSLGQTPKSAPTTNQSSRISSSPELRTGSGKDNFRFRPGRLSHSTSSPTGKPSESPSVHFAVPGVTPSPECSVTSSTETTPLKITSRTVLDASGLVAPPIHISSVARPDPAVQLAGEQNLANDLGNSPEQNEVGAFSDLVKSIGDQSISAETTLARSEATAKPGLTWKESPKSGEIPRIEEESRARNVSGLQDVMMEKKLSRTGMDLATQKEFTKGKDPREDESSITRSSSIGGESTLDETESSDDEDSATDEDSDYWYALASDEDSENDMKQTEIKLTKKREKMARKREELAEECRQLAEEQMLATNEKDYVAKWRKKLIAAGLSLPDGGEASASSSEEAMRKEEGGNEDKRKENEKGEEGPKKGLENKTETKEGRILPSPDTTREQQAEGVFCESEVRPVAEPGIKLGNDQRDESTTDSFTSEIDPKALSTSTSATNKSHMEGCDETKEVEASKLGPSMDEAGTKSAPCDENMEDLKALPVLNDVLVPVDDRGALSSQTSAPTKSTAADSPLSQVELPRGGNGDADFQPFFKTGTGLDKYRSSTCRQQYHIYSPEEMRQANCGSRRRLGNNSVSIKRRLRNRRVIKDTLGTSIFIPSEAKVIVDFAKNDSDVTSGTSWLSTSSSTKGSGGLRSEGIPVEKPTEGSSNSPSILAQPLFTEKAPQISTDTDCQTSLDAWRLFCSGNRDDVTISNSKGQRHSTESFPISASTPDAGERSTPITTQEAGPKEGHKVSLQNNITLQLDTSAIEPLRFRCQRCRNFLRNIISFEAEEILRSGGELLPPPQCAVCHSSCPLFRYLPQDTDPQITLTKLEDQVTGSLDKADQEPAKTHDRVGDSSTTLALVCQQDAVPKLFAREKADAEVEQASTTPVDPLPPIFSFGQAPAVPTLREFTWSSWNDTSWSGVFGVARVAPAKSRSVKREPEDIKARNPAIIKMSKAGKKVVIRLPPSV